VIYTADEITSWPTDSAPSEATAPRRSWRRRPRDGEADEVALFAHPRYKAEAAATPPPAR
jgi:hypothetical protein